MREVELELLTRLICGGLRKVSAKSNPTRGSNFLKVHSQSTLVWEVSMDVDSESLDSFNSPQAPSSSFLFNMYSRQDRTLQRF
jgi:hypothetical protein